MSTRTCPTHNTTRTHIHTFTLTHTYTHTHTLTHSQTLFTHTHSRHARSGAERSAVRCVTRHVCTQLFAQKRWLTRPCTAHFGPFPALVSSGGHQAVRLRHGRDSVPWVLRGLDGYLMKDVVVLQGELLLAYGTWWIWVTMLMLASCGIRTVSAQIRQRSCFRSPWFWCAHVGCRT